MTLISFLLSLATNVMDCFFIVTENGRGNKGKMVLSLCAGFEIYKTGFINVFTRRTTDCHSCAKLVELNIFNEKS